MKGVLKVSRRKPLLSSKRCWHGRDEFGRRFERYARRTVSRTGWTPLNPMQVIRLRASWPVGLIGIRPPDEAESGIPTMRGSLLHWEEAVRQIARGWDCLDEYTHDVWARLLLAEDLDECRALGIELPPSYLRRLDSVDRAFKRITYDSGRCCLMEGEYGRDQSARFFHRQEAEYPKRRFWSLYRWPYGTVQPTPP